MGEGYQASRDDGQTVEDDRVVSGMEILAVVETLNPPVVHICTVEDDRGALVTLEPFGLTMTKNQALLLIAKLAGTVGVLQEREANSLAARAGQWVADNVTPEAKAEHEHNINIEIASRVEALAADQGVPDEELISLIQVDGDTFSRLMLGVIPWDFEQIGRIAGRLSVDPFLLLTGANR